MQHADDLTDLNQRLVTFFSESCADKKSVSAYLNYLPVCLARLSASAQDLEKFMAGSGRQLDNPLHVVYVNRDFLNVARLIAKEIVAGDFTGLVAMHCSIDQARILSVMTNRQITHLAMKWPGPIFELIADSCSWVADESVLHPHAMPHFAAAMATSSAQKRVM